MWIRAADKITYIEMAALGLFKPLNGFVRQSYILRRQPRLALHASAALRFEAEEEPFLIKSQYPDVPLSKASFADFMWSNANKHQDRVALVCVAASAFFLSSFDTSLPFLK